MALSYPKRDVKFYIDDPDVSTATGEQLESLAELSDVKRQGALPSLPPGEYKATIEHMSIDHDGSMSLAMSVPVCEAPLAKGKTIAEVNATLAAAMRRPASWLNYKPLQRPLSYAEIDMGGDFYGGFDYGAPKRSSKREIGRMFDDAMDVADKWREVCAAVEVRGPIAMKFVVRSPGLTGCCIQAVITVDDTTNPGSKVELFASRFPPSSITTREAMIQYIRVELIHWFFRHEADEHTFTDGTRQHVPHHEHGR